MQTIFKLLLTGTFLSSHLASAEITQVYIASAKDGIYATKLQSESGKLTDPIRVASITHGGFLTMHPNQKYIYATGDVEKKVGGVIAFKISEDGKLTPVSKQSAQGSRLCHLSLDATSRVLMGANYGDGNVVSFLVKPDGSMGKLASIHQHKGSSVHPRQTKPHAHSIYAGPNNQFAYAPDLGIDKVMIYSIDPPTAKLTPTGEAVLPAGSGPRHMKFGKQGKHAYVLNELNSTVSVFNRSSDGKLIAQSVVSTLPKDVDRSDMTCSEIRVSIDGRFIYCANRDLSQRGRDSLSVFKIAQGGSITRIQTIGAEVWIPRNINLDPSGRWLLVAGQKSNDVPVFKVDLQSGKLTFTTHKIMVPMAMCIVFQK